MAPLKIVDWYWSYYVQALIDLAECAVRGKVLMGINLLRHEYAIVTTTTLQQSLKEA